MTALLSAARRARPAAAPRGPASSRRSRRLRALCRWLPVLPVLAGLSGLALLASCRSYPDKRVLQYLNSDGFGKRYTGNAEEENYITIGDRLAIYDSYHSDELDVARKVDIDGTVLLPELGAVQVAGMTRTELETLLMDKYSPYYDLLDIKVQIQAAGKKYFIFGEVGTEGERPFEGDLTIFEAVMKAGPQDDSANLGRVRLIRPDPRDPLQITVDVLDMFDGDSTFNVLVQEYDIIYVPPTMLAQVGYFLDTLLFPVKQVLSGLSNAVSTLWRLEGGGRGGRRNNNTIF